MSFLRVGMVKHRLRNIPNLVKVLMDLLGLKQLVFLSIELDNIKCRFSMRIRGYRLNTILGLGQYLLLS